MTILGRKSAEPSSSDPQTTTLRSPRGPRYTSSTWVRGLVFHAILASVLALLAWALTDSSTLQGSLTSSSEDAPPSGQTFLVTASFLLFAVTTVAAYNWPFLGVLGGCVLGAVFVTRLLQFELIRRSMTLGLPPNVSDERLIYSLGVAGAVALVVWAGRVFTAEVSTARRSQRHSRARVAQAPAVLLAGDEPGLNREEPEDGSLGQWIKMLKHGEVAERSSAAEALGRVGPDAQAAVGPLVRALNDPSAEVRRAATDALGRIVDDEL